jgi:hypothetical protein
VRKRATNELITFYDQKEKTMAGKPGMHKRPLSPARVEEMRQKIRGTLIIKALENHCINEAEMSSSQVSAALGLLRKIVPDLSAVSLAGEVRVRPIQEMTDQEIDTLLAASYPGDNIRLIPLGAAGGREDV